MKKALSVMWALGLSIGLACTAVGATYHVSVKGDDGNPGTRAKPVRTIMQGAKMAKAGDTVVVGPGRYNEYVLVPNSGAPGKPITFRASGKGETIVSAAQPLTGFVKTPNARNLYHTDIGRIYGLKAPGKRPGSSNLPRLECYGLIDDTTLHAYTMLPSPQACDVVPGSFYLDRNARRIYLHTADSNLPSKHKLELSIYYGTFYVSGKTDIIIEGFTIKHAWRQRGAGVLFAHKSQRVVLRNCRMENCWRGFCASLDAEDCVVQNCEVVNCVNGIRFSYLHRGRVAGNRIVRKGDHWPFQPSRPSVGIYFYCFYRDGDNMAWIENNYIQGFGNAIRLKSPAVGVCRNNTIVDCDFGILARTGPRREFVNNLLVNCRTPLTIADKKLPETFVSDYNCAYDSRDPAASKRWLATWRERTKQAHHTVTALPKIIGTWPGAMFLAPTSPCIGAGENGANIGSLPVAPKLATDRLPPVGHVRCAAQAGEWQAPSPSLRQRGEALPAMPWQQAQETMTAVPYARGNTVTVQTTAWDAEGAVTAMRFSNDGKEWSEPVPFAPRHVAPLSPGDGKKAIYAQFQDEAGNWSERTMAEVQRKEKAPHIIGEIETRTNRYGACITWIPSEPCEGVLHYGPTRACRNTRRAFLFVGDSAEARARHVVFLAIPQIPAAASTCFKVELRDMAGNTSVSQIHDLRLEGKPRAFSVSVSGDDSGPGTSKEPWRTLAKATRSALPGDIVTVNAGLYYEPLVICCGGASEESRITYRADGPVIIERAQKWPYGAVLEGLKFVTIEGFEFRGWTHSGVHVKECSDIVIRSNRIHSGCAQRLTQRTPYVGKYGVYIHLSQRVNVEYNQVFWNCRDMVFYFTEDCRADHNTIIQTVYAGFGIWGTLKGLTLTNNIIVHNGNDQLSMSASIDTMTSDYNCWLKRPRGSKAMTNVKGKRRQTLKEWQEDFGLDKHSISADPLFVDEDNGDLRLKQGSPCIKAGSGGTNIGAM